MSSMGEKRVDVDTYVTCLQSYLQDCYIEFWILVI